MSEAAAAAGWKLETLDGGGAIKDQLSSLNQAIAQKPDGIVIGGWNPNVTKIPLKKAISEGITLVAWHAVPEPGPIPKYNVFYNVTSDSNQVSQIAAQFAVVKSNGQAKVLIFTDSLYQIALDKANVMKKEIEKCSGCQVLEFIDTPLADTANRMPSMTFSLLQKYGDKFQYALAINDLYFDFMAPSLKTGGKGGDKAPFNISAGDGSISAYQRIRSGDSQSATVPEPLKLHGWQLLDELNRAFAKQSPSGYVTPAHLVTRDNRGNDGVSLFRASSNFANGNALDSEGRIISCEHGRRGISRTEHNGEITMLVERVDGKRFNSPNDVVVRSDGTIWFTDPPYGIINDEEGYKSESQVIGCYVYCFDPRDASLNIATSDVQRHNGLAFSPNESLLYVADMSIVDFPTLGRRELRVFSVEENNAGPGRFSRRLNQASRTDFALTARATFFAVAKTALLFSTHKETRREKFRCRNGCPTVRWAANTATSFILPPPPRSTVSA